MKIYNKNSFNSATICFATATIKDSVIEVDIKGNTFIRNESNGEDVACIKHRLIPKLVLNKESDIEKHNLKCFEALENIGLCTFVFLIFHISLFNLFIRAAFTE